MQRTAAAACRCTEIAAAPRRVRRALWRRRPSFLSAVAALGCSTAVLALADSSKEDRMRAQLLVRCGYLISTADQSSAITLASVNEATKAHAGMVAASLDRLVQALLELVQRADSRTRRELVERGALAAVLQFIAHEKPTDPAVLKCTTALQLWVLTPDY